VVSNLYTIEHWGQFLRTSLHYGYGDNYVEDKIMTVKVIADNIQEAMNKAKKLSPKRKNLVKDEDDYYRLVLVEEIPTNQSNTEQREEQL
jgi:hypothetical protein